MIIAQVADLESLSAQLNYLRSKSNYLEIANLLSYSLQNNHSSLNRQVFNYVPNLFRQIELNDISANKDNFEVPVGEPVIYKINFPNQYTMGDIPFFYVFCFIKKDCPKLNIYFQSASANSKSLTANDYDLSKEKVNFEGIISAFTEKFSTICISDPGHFISSFTSSFYVGTKDLNFTELIAKAIESICYSARIDLRDTFLFGSSAGGQGALLTSTYFSSKVNVLAVNSQISIYSKSKLMRKLLEIDAPEEILKKFGEQVCCKHRFQQQLIGVPNIYILANLHDSLYQRNYAFYQAYQKTFANQDGDNQSIFDSYCGVEGHGRPHKKQLKAKIAIARISLTMDANSADQKSNKLNTIDDVGNSNLNDNAAQNIAKQSQLDYRKGIKLQKKGKTAESLQYLHQAANNKPDFSKPLIALAHHYQSQEQWNEAAKCYLRLIALKPDIASLRVKLARVLKPQNKLYSGIAAFYDAIDLKPGVSPKIYQELGELLIETKSDVRDIVAAYTQGIENNPNWQPSYTYCIGLADALTKQQDFDLAISYYQQAANINSRSPATYPVLTN